MSNRTFITILERHSIEWIDQDGEIIAFTEVCVDGITWLGEWFTCRDVRDLMHWLGY